MSRGGDARERRARGLVPLATVGALVIAGLGWSWARDRARPWETPRWDPARFVALSGWTDDGAAAPRARWVVPVNPACPHCAGYVARAAELPRPRGVRLALLLVDAARPVDLGELLRPGVDEAWWDREGVWRGSWGHRVYGEVLWFGAEGEFQGALGTGPAGQVPPHETPGGGGG